MKAINIYVLFILVFFTSCEEFLEETPPTFISSANFWQSESDARTGTDAVYKTLFDGSQNSIYGRWWPAMDLGTDDVTSKLNQNMFLDWLKPEVKMSASNPWLESYQQYQGFWKGVSRANDALENIVSIDMDEVVKNEILSEARALRAFNYFQLVRTWGDMPFIVSSIDTDKPEEFNLPRSSVNRIYEEIIIPDLVFAAENGKDGLHTGRITKWTAKIILADVYMNYAGWRRTSQGDFVEGDPLYWELAMAAAKDIIDNGPHSLMVNDFVDGAHTTPACGVPWLESQPYCEESMFELGAVNVAGFGSYLSRECRSNLKGLYFWGDNESATTAIGGHRPFPNEQGYETKNVNGMVFTQTPSVGNYIPSPDLYTHFELVSADLDTINDIYFDADKRRDWSLMTQYTRPDGTRYVCQPTLRKYVDIDYFKGAPNTSFINTNNNFILYRYADALLIYAEAQNEVDGSPNTDAYSAINEIRVRAGLPAYTPVTLLDSSNYISGADEQERFQSAVWRERRSEFVGEVKRRFDLIRTDRVSSETSSTSFTKRYWLKKSILIVHAEYGNQLGDYDWLMPIPQTEINLNQANGWTQNSGF